MKPWMRRLTFVALVAVGASLGVQQWLASAGSWACEANPQCVASIALDIESVGFGGAHISWQAFDISPDGSEIVVALTTSDSLTRNDDRLLIGTFSTASGELLTTLVREELVDFVAVDEVRYSPDGSLIAGVWYELGGRLDVFDAATGALVNTVIQTDDRASIPCDGVLGMSPTNDTVQCGSVVFERSTGAVMTGNDEARPLAVKIGGSLATSFSGLTADGLGQSGIHVSRRSLVPADTIVVIEPEVFDGLDRSLMAFGDGSAGDEYLVLLEDAKRWRWWASTPRRRQPEARVSVYAADTGALDWTAELADRTSALAVNDNGLIATISTDGIVVVFDLG